MTTTKTNVTELAIKNLQQDFRSNWVSSVELIYTFANAYLQASLEKAVSKRGFTTTKKSNAFTCAAKLAVMEKDANGTWVVSDAQVSRYSKVCLQLHKNNVSVGGVAKFLKGKSLNSILSAPKKPVDKKTLQKEMFDGLFEIEKDFKNVTVNKQQINIKGLGAEEGVNLAVVVADVDGNITAMTVASHSSKFTEIAKDIVRHKAPKADNTNVAEDAIASAVAAKTQKAA